MLYISQQGENYMEGKNPFFERLKQYMNQNVIVTLKSGSKIEGKLVSINFLTMNFILEGKKEDYVIRDDVSFIAIPKTR